MPILKKKKHLKALTFLPPQEIQNFYLIRTQFKSEVIKLFPIDEPNPQETEEKK